MAAAQTATLKSLRIASTNFPSITGVQNLNAGICESNKVFFPLWHGERINYIT